MDDACKQLAAVGQDFVRNLAGSEYVVLRRHDFVHFVCVSWNQGWGKGKKLS